MVPGGGGRRAVEPGRALDGDAASPGMKRRAGRGSRLGYSGEKE